MPTYPDRLRRAAVELSRISIAEIDEPKRRTRVQRIAQAITRGQLSMECCGGTVPCEAGPVETGSF